jgi:hypothetical protein
MKFFQKPLSEYARETRLGLGLLAALAVVRFLLKPVFDIPYARGTTFSSVTLLGLILMLVYAVRAARARGTYRDLLGIAAALSYWTSLLVIVAIVIDDFGGIDTYYTDLAHGGNLNPWAHIGGHVIGAILGTLILWGIGSLVYLVAKPRSSPA